MVAKRSRFFLRLWVVFFIILRFFYFLGTGCFFCSKISAFDCRTLCDRPFAILGVNIFRGDRGAVGEHCLLLALFDFNYLKFSRKNSYFFRQVHISFHLFKK